MADADARKPDEPLKDEKEVDEQGDARAPLLLRVHLFHLCHMRWLYTRLHFVFLVEETPPSLSSPHVVKGNGTHSCSLHSSSLSTRVICSPSHRSFVAHHPTADEDGARGSDAAPAALSGPDGSAEGASAETDRTRYTKVLRGLYIVAEGVRPFVNHVVSEHLHPRVKADVRRLLGSDAPCRCGNTNFADTDERKREGEAGTTQGLG